MDITKIARRIAIEVMDELDGRKGILEDVDQDVWDEIEVAIRQIVRDELETIEDD